MEGPACCCCCWRCWLCCCWVVQGVVVGMEQHRCCKDWLSVCTCIHLRQEYGFLHAVTVPPASSAASSLDAVELATHHLIGLGRGEEVGALT